MGRLRRRPPSSPQVGTLAGTDLVAAGLADPAVVGTRVDWLVALTAAPDPDPDTCTHTCTDTCSDTWTKTCADTWTKTCIETWTETCIETWTETWTETCAETCADTCAETCADQNSIAGANLDRRIRDPRAAALRDREGRRSPTGTTAPLRDVLADYPSVAEGKWAAWRPRSSLLDLPQNFAEVLGTVIAFADPVIDDGVATEIGIPSSPRGSRRGRDRDDADGQTLSWASTLCPGAIDASNLPAPGTKRTGSGAFTSIEPAVQLADYHSQGEDA